MKENSLHELPFDERDYSFSENFGALAVEDLPTQDFLVAVPLEIKDQDINYPSDYCTSYAASEAADLQDQVKTVPEYTFAYAKWLLAIERRYGVINEFGLNLRDICKAGVKGGFLPRSKDPFKCNTTERPSREFLGDFRNWPEDLAQYAEIYRKENYYSAVDGPHDLFDNFRSVLWKNRRERRAIITGCYFRSSWMTVQGGIIPKTYESVGSPHAFIFIGQKTINGEIYLVALLSSNIKYGDNGLFYFPREVVNREFKPFGAFTFKDLSPIISTDGVELTKINKWNPLWIFKTIINYFK